MKEQNEIHRSIINYCFDEALGRFTREQSLHIILGAATIKWVSMKSEYSASNLRMERILDAYEDTFQVLHHELKNFESCFYEFDGIITGIMSKVFIYKDKVSDKKLKNILQVIDNAEFLSADEVRRFINMLVQIGALQTGFNETPESINTIITGLIDFERVRSFADYCSGTSRIAIEIFERLRQLQRNEDVFYYGEEINVDIYLISKLLMIINEIYNYRIVNKDVLSYTEDDRGFEFDFVVCDIPQIMGLDKHLNINDPRFIYGIPSRSSADWIFAQNALYHLNEKGKGVIIGTKGTLVRSNEIDIRRGILYNDLIECVITLPDNLYEKSSIGTELIIFNRHKDISRQNKILFINASEYKYRLNKNQHAISKEGITKILECYEYGVEEVGFSKFVDLEKLEEYDYRINPIEYLEYDVLKNTLTNSVALKEIAQVTSGVQISKKDLEELSKHSTHHFLNIKDIDEGRINYDESSMITFKKNDWLGRYDIEPGDIILTSKGWAVKVAIVEENFKPAFFSGNLTRIRINPEKYNSYVLYEFLQSEIGAKMLEGLQTGTTIKLLNNSQLERLEVPMFDMNFLDEIGHEIKKSKRLYERSIAEATRTFEEKRKQLMGNLGWSINQKK